MDLEDLEEMVSFLGEKRSDVRAEACKHVMNLTGTDSGIASLLLSDQDVCSLLLRCIGDVQAISTNATKALVNLTTNARAQLTLWWSCYLTALNILSHLQDLLLY